MPIFLYVWITFFLFWLKHILSPPATLGPSGRNTVIQVPRGVMVRELRIGTPTCPGTEKEDLADLDKAWGGTTGGQNSITTIIHRHPSVMFSQNFWSNKYIKRCCLTWHKPSKDEGNSCLKLVLASASAIQPERSRSASRWWWRKVAAGAWDPWQFDPLSIRDSLTIDPLGYEFDQFPWLSFQQSHGKWMNMDHL